LQLVNYVYILCWGRIDFFPIVYDIVVIKNYLDGAGDSMSIELFYRSSVFSFNWNCFGCV